MFNRLLREFLISRGISHFIPSKAPSYEKHPNKMTFCYYHDMELYNFVYNSAPGYVIMPMIVSPINDIYYKHALDGWYDPRSNTGCDEDSDEDTQ
jgi:hypothetical protein